jgi:hypothetical protein
VSALKGGTGDGAEAGDVRAVNKLAERGHGGKRAGACVASLSHIAVMRTTCTK